MGNQCSGLQRRPHFDCIERFGNKQRSTDTITSKDVRLSADQINKIEEYHQRFIKENNPTEVFFNIDYDFKVDQGGSIQSKYAQPSKFEANDQNQESTDCLQINQNSHKNLDVIDQISASRSSSLRRLLKLDQDGERRSSTPIRSKQMLHLDHSIVKTDKDNEDHSSNDQAAIYQHNYENEKDESDFCKSFGYPSFNKANVQKFPYDEYLKKQVKSGYEGTSEYQQNSIKLVDNESDSAEDHHNKNKYSTEIIYPSPDHNKECDSNLDERNRYTNLESYSPCSEQEIVEFNDHVNSETSPPIKDKSSYRNSKQTILISHEEGNLLKSNDFNSSPFHGNLMGTFENQKYTDLESPHNFRNNDDYEAYTTLIRSNGNFDSKHLSRNNKDGIRMNDASTIELNQSSEFGEFDEVLNSLNKEFMSRKTKRFNNVFKSYEL